MTNTIKDLTVREREVLKFLVEGMSSREIAEKLYISINTVQYHRKQLLHKTDSRNVAELIGKAYRFRLIDFEWWYKPILSLSSNPLPSHIKCWDGFLCFYAVRDMKILHFVTKTNMARCLRKNH